MKREGVSVELPHPAETRQDELPGGWKVLAAAGAHATVHVATKVGAKSGPKTLRNLAAKLLELSPDTLEVGEKARSVAGWHWRQRVDATVGDRVIVGALGVGPRGSAVVLAVAPAGRAEDLEPWFGRLRLR